MVDHKSAEELALPKALTAKKKDLSDWYSQVLFFADIIDIRYNLKGFNVWKGYGYQLMMNIKRYWDDLFQKNGIQEMYFPMIVPVEYCEQNPDWWAGFKTEGFKVIAGEKNEIQGVLRPTGEPAMYPMYSMWIRTHQDLPFKAYETVSSFRYETQHTRPLIRDREITIWHEVHTVHATKEDSLEEANRHVEYYKAIWKHLALSPVIVEKPSWEVFPGAIGGIEFYYITANGKAMENGSVNILGQAYAKKFNVKYKDKDNQDQYAWQVCTGNGARLLAALILEHGDDKGLILPPSVAPYQVVIIPIIFEKQRKEIMAEVHKVQKALEKEGIRVLVDDKEESPGSKFYNWEIKGVPIRIEIGPKDVEKEQVTLVKRIDGKKEAVKVSKIAEEVQTLLKDIQTFMLARAITHTKERIFPAHSPEELGKLIDQEKVAVVHWDKSGESYDAIKKIRIGPEIFGSDNFVKKKGKDLISGKETDNLAYVARTY